MPVERDGEQRCCTRRRQAGGVAAQRAPLRLDRFDHHLQQEPGGGAADAQGLGVLLRRGGEPAAGRGKLSAHLRRQRPRRAGCEVERLDRRCAPRGELDLVALQRRDLANASGAQQRRLLRQQIGQSSHDAEQLRRSEGRDGHHFVSCARNISRCTASAMPTPPLRAATLLYSCSSSERYTVSPAPPPNIASLLTPENTFSKTCERKNASKSCAVLCAAVGSAVTTGGGTVASLARPAGCRMLLLASITSARFWAGARPRF